MLLMKSSENSFIFLPVFYLIIMWTMKAPKNFGKIYILKIWQRQKDLIIKVQNMRVHN